jgi:radical SAM superfamily enzyme YgiQ (UPF0313 family)
MNVLLINIVVNGVTEELNNPPLGLAYIGAMIEEIGHTPRVFNLTLEEIENGCWKEEFKDFSPKVVGATLITPLYSHTINFFEKVKSIFPSVYIIVGGPHAAALPAEVIKEPAIDFVIRGEGEYIIQELLYSIEHHKNISNIKGLTFKRDSLITHNQEVNPIENLDDLPLPAWHLFEINKFKSMQKKGKIMGMIGSRGCPFDCIFCYRGPSNTKKIRFRTLDNIFKEIRFLKQHYEFEGINFWDDVFTLDKERTKEFCIKFKEYFPNLIWYCQTRIDYLDKELLELMETSGCRLLRLGIESGNDNILKLLNKQITVSLIREKFRLIKQFKNIKTKTYFVLGFPWDTYETIQETICFAKELASNETMFFTAIPYPGTKLYRQTQKHILSLKYDFSQYNHFCNREIINTFYPVQGIENSEIVKTIRKANDKLRFHK